MATDATGTPTSLGIPKFNTSVDSPSGLGSNAQMDAIDALLLQAPRSGAISGIAVGSVPVWNGSAWVKPSGTPDGTKFLRDDGTWQSVTTPTTGYGTALPGSPTDGQEFILVDSTTAPTYQWRLRYNASNAGSSKWECVGGVPAFSEVLTSQGTSSSSYAALATAGPSFTIPVTGSWEVEIGAFIIAQDQDTAGTAHMSYDIGGTGAVDADAVIWRMDIQTGANIPLGATMSRKRVKTITGSSALVAKYKSNNTGTISVANRWMAVLPRVIG